VAGNGGRAVAEANFSAAYGYDVRGEVFGSKGMVTVGSGARSSAQVVVLTCLMIRSKPSVRASLGSEIRAYHWQAGDFAGHGDRGQGPSRPRDHRTDDADMKPSAGSPLALFASPTQQGQRDG
jgi:hypothetical protein